MAGSQRLEVRQSQALVMTPQLQQSLKLLQFSTQEMAEFIEQELEKNPLLSREESPEPSEEAPSSETPSEASQERDIVDTAQENSSPDAAGEVLDVDHENTWQTDQSAASVSSGPADPFSSVAKRGANFDGEDSLEQQLASEVDLKDHLMDQVYMDFKTPAKRLIAAHLIDLLDESGYFYADLAEQAEQMGCEMELADEVFSRLQKCDPPGIFARNLAECLALQLKDKGRYDPAMQKLVANLELLAEGDLDRLKKLCGVDDEDFAEMCAEIRALDPKPGRAFDHTISETLIPDVFVRKDPKSDTWIVELNHEALPRVLLDRTYYAEVKSRVSNDEEKKFVAEQWNDANWLVKTMNQRAETILKVAIELVKQQQEFFTHGVRYLKPLTLKDIAQKVEVHESTVGRVTTNKYMSTSRGVYEMKFFFSSSIASATDEDAAYSSTSVKHIIKEMIENETTDEVLSDDKIADILKQKGMNIARRTVAKYREEFNIPSSFQRRQQKRKAAKA